MFDGIGPTEILLIIVVLVLLFGGKKIPELAQGIGKGIREFKKAVKDVPEDGEQRTDENKTNKQ
ncbi:MAG: twin-arginine translocase TatA/TatE family subunit [Bacteroidetes bacterium]|nr:twin-arginine translocase TatA/TatE family subunit [Bacteroidota bacterium]